jgi:hypothetical protein
MPSDNGSGCDQDERPLPFCPEPSYDNPKQLVESSQSTAGPFGVQRWDLLTEGEIFKNEVLSRTQGTDNPSQEISERRHQARQGIHSANARGFDEGHAHPETKSRSGLVGDSISTLALTVFSARNCGLTI